MGFLFMYKLSVPILIARYPEVKREAWLAELRRAKADRVFLAVCRSVDSAEEKAKALRSLNELIPYFEGAGLEVGVWTSSLGHGGNGYDHLTYTRIRSVSGDSCGDSMCPLDRAFGKELGEWLRDIALTGAKLIMLDDDYRLSYRAGNVGCVCDLHMAEFAKLTGQALSREEIVQKVFTGAPSRYRDAWLRMSGDSLRSLATQLRTAVDTVSDRIRLGHCAVLSTWDVDGVDSIDLAKIFAGSTRPFLRLIGAPYWAVRQNWGCRLGSIIEMERMQRKWCENEDIEIFSEGDVYPRPRFNVPAVYAEGFDSALRADGGLDGILKYMLDYDCSPRYETGYIDRHVRHMPLYREIEKHFSTKPAAGVRVFEVMHKLQGAILPDDFPGGNYIAETFIPSSARFLCDNSIPMQYDTPDVTIVFGENARYATGETLQYGAILDAPAAEILTQRGFDVGLRNVLGKAKVRAEYYPKQDETVPVGGTYYNMAIDRLATIVTRLKGVDAIGGAYEYENRKGWRFLVYPFHAYEARQHDRVFRCYCRMRQLVDSIKYIRRKPMDVVCLNNPDLYIQCKKDDTSLSVGLWNFSADEIFAPKIALADEYEESQFINCTGQLCQKEVALSELAPFGFAAVVLKRTIKK